MDPASDRSSPRRYGYLIRGACACAAAIAAMDLVGWWSGVNALTHLLPGYPGMNPLTAICLLLTAAALWILGVERSHSAARTLARAMAALVLTLASLRALELGFGIDLPLDDVLFGSRVLAVTFPARMSAHTAFTLVCIGSALVVHDLPGRAGRRLDEILLVVATAVVLTVLTGYLYAASPMHGLMPLPTAAATLLAFCPAEPGAPGAPSPATMVTRSSTSAAGVTLELLRYTAYDERPARPWVPVASGPSMSTSAMVVATIRFCALMVMNWLSPASSAPTRRVSWPGTPRDARCQLAS